MHLFDFNVCKTYVLNQTWRVAPRMASSACSLNVSNHVFEMAQLRLQILSVLGGSKCRSESFHAVRAGTEHREHTGGDGERISHCVLAPVELAVKVALTFSCSDKFMIYWQS